MENSTHEAAARKVTIDRWRSGRLVAISAALAYPVFRVLNRPSMAWFGMLAYDFALRRNGIAINFRDRYGRSIAEEAFLQRLAPRLQKGVVLDVGANTGSYAAAVARLAPSARIIAFEPHPATFRRLQERLAAIDRGHVEAVNLAVGDASGILELHDFADADGSTQASLSAEAVALYGAGVVSHPVEVTTLDDFLAARDIGCVDYLKIDTEGYDLNVLKGARRALAEGRIRVIQFEFVAANITTGVRMRDFFEVLDGYDIHRICLNGALLPLGPYSVKRHEIYVNHNLVAVRRG